jgi:hypothetical protein
MEWREEYVDEPLFIIVLNKCYSALGRIFPVVIWMLTN